MSDEKSHLVSNLQFLSDQSDFIHRDIERADTKAAWSFAIVSSLILYNSSRLDSVCWECRPAELVLVYAAIAFLSFSGFHSFRVITPRLDGNPKGLFYFGAVATQETAADFGSKVSGLGIENLVGERASHNFEIAKICSDKFQWLRHSFILGVIGLAICAVSLGI